jgi:hypothetical protein
VQLPRPIKVDNGAKTPWMTIKIILVVLERIITNI